MIELLSILFRTHLPSLSISSVPFCHFPFLISLLSFTLLPSSCLHTSSPHSPSVGRYIWAVPGPAAGDFLSLGSVEHFSLHLHTQRYVRPGRLLPTSFVAPSRTNHIPIPQSAPCSKPATLLLPLPARFVFRRPIIFSFGHSSVYFFFHLVPHCVHRAPLAPRSFTVTVVEYISHLIRVLTTLTGRSHRLWPFIFLFFCSLLAITQVSHTFLLHVFSSHHTHLVLSPLPLSLGRADSNFVRITSSTRARGPPIVFGPS